jgi:hypothetical protein
MSHHRLARLIVAGTVAAGGAAGLTTLAAGQSGAAGSAVNITAKCTGTSAGNLQIQRERAHTLSVDFGVDMARHKAGVQWKVAETDNGSTFVSTTAKTIRDGSFSITKQVTSAAAANTVVGTAVNPATGETCSITGTL